MCASPMMFGAALLLFCGVMVPSLAQQEPNVSSERVNCTQYASQCAHLCPVSTCSKNKTLYIQGFVPANNDVYESETIIPAAFAAIDDINANCSILPDYNLQLEFVNTMCDPSEATWQLISAIVLREEQQKPRIMFLGGGCSLAPEPLAALAGRVYKISMISYGASSPSLSTVEMFPNFFRTIPSEVQSNSARFALMNKYGWEKVATLHETQTIFSQTVEDFHTQYDNFFNRTDNENGDAEDENLILRSFTDDPEIPLRQIKDKDIRIIMGYFYEDKAIATLCRAYKMGLTTENHVWMFPAWYRPDWYKEDYKLPNNNTVLCTKAELQEAVKYSFFLDSYNETNEENYSTDTGSTSTAKFLEKYNCYLQEFRNNPQSSGWTNNTGAHAYISFTYDAVWAMAFALDETQKELDESNPGLTLDQFDYFNRTSNITEAITRHLENTSFAGVSGEVTFDESGDRRGLNGIYQLREVNGEMVQVLLAVHDPGVKNSSGLFNYNFNFTTDPLWKGDGPPKDRRTPENVYMIEELVIFGHFLTTVAVVIALALLVFNLATLWKPLIRDSAPHINTIVIVGCLVMLLGCYLLGIDSNNPPQEGDNDYVHQQNDTVPMDVLLARNHRYKVICTLRLWVLTLGFTLSFGALFAKTWQVYRVYTNNELKKKTFKMWNFFIIMGILLVIDIAYLGFWTGLYPFYRNVHEEDENNSNEDTLRKFEECKCENYGYLIGALYVYKGLLVVFGLFLAYESRNVKYPQINDSRFVSITMYIVVILVGIGAPLSLVLAVHYFIDAAYMLAVLMIIAACMSCLLILYIPKFYYMAKGEDTMVSENQREEITVSDGLQLGRSTVDTTDIKTVEDEVNTLQKQVNEKQFELKELQSQNGPSGGSRPRNGSDGDSGVLVTGDENETFSTESTANGDHIRADGGEAGACSAIGRIDTTTPTILDEGEEEPEATSDGTNV